MIPDFGIEKSSLKWLDSYLTNRSQVIKINGFTSNLMILNRGAPQGSMLGPLLFILYINSLCNLDIDGKIMQITRHV